MNPESQKARELLAGLNAKQRHRLLRRAERALATPDKKLKPPHDPAEREAWDALMTARQSQRGTFRDFTCRRCGAPVSACGHGSEHRNHCPRCLFSLHLDTVPGDRKATCGGLMEPIAVWVRRGGEWAIIHRCTECGKLDSNRVAADDNVPLLLSLAVRPISAPPFPLERVEDL